MTYENAVAAADTLWDQLVTPKLQSNLPYGYGLVGLGIVTTGDDHRLLLSLRDEADWQTVESDVLGIDVLGIETLTESDLEEPRITGSYFSLGSLRFPPGTPLLRQDDGKADGPGGALGALVQKGRETYILGAEHVFNNYGLGNGKGDLYWSGSGSSGGGSAFLGSVSQVVGPDYDNHQVVNYFDCAIAGPVVGANFDGGIPCFELAHFETQPADPTVRDVVRKCGPMEPNSTSGVVSTFPTSSRAVVSFRRNGHIVDLNFQGQIDISPQDGRPFGVEGDSGSVVAKNEEGKIVAVGLLFAGSDRENSYLANPMKAVKEKLAFDLFF